MTRALAVIVLLLLFAGDLRAQARPDFTVSRAAERPKIDGVLDDDVWKQAALPLGEWLSYNPLPGDKMPNDYRTEVRIAYDDRNIYFAFHCFDNEPGKIRTTISRRDSSFSDDWIAMSLDSAGTGQAAYHLFTNPSGSQMDALNTSASGEQFDADMVWYSVGKVTNDGYVVEVELPLQTLRFSGGDQVRMGLVFFRKISRTGVSYSWPAMPPGQWVFDIPAHLLFSNLKQPRVMEFLPSITYGVNQRRETSDIWDPADNTANFGASGKYGITSNITLDGTINPDFSQVESDAFQVEINQRFPIFYSEKRPFFMEGMGLFNIAGTNGPSNIRTAVHTRRIVNPFFGAKVTGTSGKTTFGVLNALDESPEDIGDRGDQVADARKLFTIARVTYALRRADYIGAIVTDTEHAGRHNRVAGADLSFKPSSSQQVSFTLLASTTEPATGDNKSGTGSQASYSFNTRRFTFGAQVEHFDKAFQMDTAFYNRTGFTSAWSYGEVNFYPKPGGKLQKVSPNYFAKFGRDEIQDGQEYWLSPALRLSFTKQGVLQVGYSWGREPWLGREFQTGGANAWGGVQILRWLGLNGGFNAGREIYYDRIDPFLGRSRNVNFGVTLQPNQHVTQDINGNIVRFAHASTGEAVYSVNIFNLKTTYQFDKHFFVRALTQFDSSEHRLLTDFLASYEFVPGTVAHAGYGSLYERRAEFGPQASPDERYLTVNRGLFFKVSYLRRF